MFNTEIILDPLVPAAILLALAAITIVAIMLAAWRGLPGWPWRSLAAAVVLTALANPALREEDREPLADIALVIVDESASQSIDIRPQQIAAARAGLEARLGALEGIETRWTTLRDAPAESDAGTLLMGALAEAMAGVARDRIAGAILVTDGQVHDIELAPDMPAPVHVLLTGRRDEWDRRLVVRNAPAFAIVGETVTLSLRIEDQGQVPRELAGETRAELAISVNGETPQVFRVPKGRDLELPVTLPRGGMNVLEFTTPEMPGEITGRNNAAIVAINGVRDRLRVLLVSGEPYQGGRTWRNLLKSDGAVDLVHFTILRPPEKQDGVPVTELSLIAFPTHELFMQRIEDFDLIIFDRYRRRGILPASYIDNIRRYVEAGGALLVAGGAEFGGAESLYRSPLAAIMPASPTGFVPETGFVPRLSDVGRRHPVTEGLEAFAPRPAGADGLPGWGRWFRQVELVPRSGHVVMEGDGDRPLLVLDRRGEGRIALLASDQAWLWDRGFEGGGPQLELLRRIAHWSMGEPDLEEEALDATVSGTTMTIRRRSLAELPGEILAEVETPSGRRVEQILSEVSPGRFEATLDAAEQGVYRLAQGDLTAVAAVGPAAPREFEQTIATPDLLAPLVAAGRGGMFRIEDGLPDIRLVREGRVASGRGWIGLTPRGAYVTSDIRRESLVWAGLFLLLAGLAMLAAWRREGR